ncbi:hypothetical protein FPQ18DRAFT_337468 [Pyronema domesticum]|nr:hypothetical protein FPQ18DRAFT_337468 [Pyronema domesticum]
MEAVQTIEWEIDIPTIGNLYYGDVNVIRYYNGLGKEFKTSGWNSEFHWTNRVWTLQECRGGSITGGIRDEDYERFSELIIQDGRHVGQTKLEFENSKSCIGVSELLSLRQAVDSPRNGEALPAPIRTPCGLFGVLSEVQIWKAKQEVDKIAGNGFIMSTGRSVNLPIFSETMDAEEAWTLVVRCLPPSMRDELLFRFPAPGYGDREALWFPSWEQISDLLSFPLQLHSRRSLRL